MDTLADAAFPQILAKTARELGCKSVAFTYNDSIIFLEYASDTAQAFRELDIFSVAVTAGYICYKPREAFFKYIDAANVDLKAFSQRFYKQLCGADLVLDTVRYLKHETQVWFELTSLFFLVKTRPIWNYIR